MDYGGVGAIGAGLGELAREGCGAGLGLFDLLALRLEMHGLMSASQRLVKYHPQYCFVVKHHWCETHATLSARKTHGHARVAES